MRALLALAFLAPLACGDTLIDHDGQRFIQGGGGASCDVGQVACGAGAELTCRAEGPTFCGADCVDCTATGTAPADGAVACVGQSSGHGQCGYVCSAGLLKCPSGCCTATAVAAGDAHTCAVASDGGLSCWGADDAGQVTGSASPGTPVLDPRQRFAAGATAIAAGRSHTCAVVNGAVQCWGADGSGQASPPPLSGVTALSAGQAHTCALLTSGAVRCWGASALGQTGSGGSPIASGAVAIAAGWDHTCAIVGAGVQCWGSNAAGQLGDGSGGGFSAAPVPASGLSGIDSIGAGRAHTCAATGSSNETSVDDALRCWGAAPGTAFGLGNPQTTPAIPMKSGSQSVIRFAVAEVAAGRTHTCVRRVGEDLQCFGPENGSGQLGGTPTGVAEAVAVTGSAGALGIASGADHACARFPDAATTALLLKCWGSNASGQLGDGTTVTPSTGITVPVSGR